MMMKYAGKKYLFEIASEEFFEKGKKKFDFFIRARAVSTGRFSCINNLNAILSELDVNINNKKFCDSSWIVTKKESRKFTNRAKKLLSDSPFLECLERQLDEDRALGEWENIVPIRRFALES